MKTDLQKILSISGEPGLFTYIAQARGGIIAESFVTKKRSIFRDNVKISSLSDISIYTTKEGEVSLRDVLLKMKDNLGEEDAPDPKSDTKVLEEFFAAVIPDYDHGKFYHSHMKKVVAWYNLLKQYASLDFEEEKKEEEEREKKEENKETSKSE